jgi:predicted nuclease of predicted toxin-antitoxin system
MHLLLDENISPIVGAALRAAGHNVSMAADVCPGAPDEDVVALAVDEARVLVTEDKDFGDLAVRQLKRPPGLIRLALLRWSPAQKAARLVAVLGSDGGRVQGAILTIEPGRVRRRPLP